MLERIEQIQGIGLLHNANGKPYRCHKVTLVYADNGRGKSTVAAVLRAASKADVTTMNSSCTIDGTIPPKAILQFANGHKVFFEHQAWSEPRPEIKIFDTYFIEANVHSGGSVSTTQRKNLLEFALGESAVAAREAVRQATTDAETAGTLILSYTGQLSGYHTAFTLKEFEDLPPLDNIDNLIDDCRRRITNATNAAAILARPSPAPLAEPALDIEALFSGLRRSLTDVHSHADNRVRDHVAKLKEPGAERWLSEGQRFPNDSTCPYCDQDITSSDLISAYQTYFNQGYREHKRLVAELIEHFRAEFLAGVDVALNTAAETALAHASAWSEEVNAGPIRFDREAFAVPFSSLRELVTDLLRQKKDAPTEPIGSETQRGLCLELRRSLLLPIQATNAQISTVNSAIDAYKPRLVAESIPDLQRELQKLEATKRRYQPAVADLFSNLRIARKEQTRANKAKQQAREALDAEMQQTLSQFQTSINTILNKFGAGFSIKDFGANFRGSAPRTEYGIALRGKPVQLDGGTPPFATALSESDKRTLAFAFFVASTTSDPNLADRVVVIDDPMCSLDLNRRKQTQVLLRQIGRQAHQLIVLAHDPYFLRDLRDAIKKEDNTAEIATLRLAAAPNGFSDFDKLDLDQECESPYSKSHRILNEFCAGNGGDPATVSRSIRPMLEGYLHRRFPGLVPNGLLFGQVVGLIQGAAPPSPLCHAQILVQELNDINEYAGQFHHETDANANCAAIIPTELRTYAQRALNVVHKGTP